MVPIPINPVDFTVNIDPPLPTFNPLPIVKIPTVLSKTKFADVAKSLFSLNKTPPLLPGADTIIVAPIPGDPSGFK